MGDGFQLGFRGSGARGDAGPDAVLPDVVADALLERQLGLVPEEFAALAAALAALAGPASTAELCGEDRARAAFRALGSGTPEDPAWASRTLPMDIPPAGRPRRRARAKHRAAASTRPPGRRGLSGRLGLVSGAAMALIAIAGGIVFAAGAFSPRVKDQVAAGPTSSAGPRVSAAAKPTLHGVASREPTPTAASGAVGTPQALCQAWLKDPWRPGSKDKDWDEADFDKLSALAGSSRNVLYYCWTQLPKDYWQSQPFAQYPPRPNSGRWDWTPPGVKAQWPPVSAGSDANGASQGASPPSTPGAYSR
jgi:hypothetical protein